MVLEAGGLPGPSTHREGVRGTEGSLCPGRDRIDSSALWGGPWGAELGQEWQAGSRVSFRQGSDRSRGHLGD